MTQPTIKEIKNRDKLLEYEKDELHELYLKWVKANCKKDYTESDRLRGLLDERGIDVNYTDPVFHPHFEYNRHRLRRIYERMRKYQVDIYPFQLKDLERDTG